MSQQDWLVGSWTSRQPALHILLWAMESPLKPDACLEGLLELPVHPAPWPLSHQAVDSWAPPAHDSALEWMGQGQLQWGSLRVPCVWGGGPTSHLTPATCLLAAANLGRLMGLIWSLFSKMER